MRLFKNDAIAQMQLGRAFIGIELEDEWYNVATSRLIGY